MVEFSGKKRTLSFVSFTNELVPETGSEIEGFILSYEIATCTVVHMEKMKSLKIYIAINSKIVKSIIYLYLSPVKGQGAVYIPSNSTMIAHNFK